MMEVALTAPLILTLLEKMQSVMMTTNEFAARVWNCPLSDYSLQHWDGAANTIWAESEMLGRAILGIVGNVGPEADELLQRLIRLEAMAHGAKKDQDYLPMIVVKNPEITDRTLAIFEGGPSPALGIVESCKILESCGVYLAALPSNTSHFFKNEYQSNTAVYVIDIIAVTMGAVQALGATKAGLLATTPTIATGLYDKRGNRAGPVFVAPKPDAQEKFVQSAIYGSLDPSGRHDRRNGDGLKSGREGMAVERLCSAIKILVDEEDLHVFIAGCTEVSIVLEKLRDAFPQCTFLDPMKCLAQRAYSLTIAAEKLLLANEDIAPIDLEAALNDEDLVAGYIASKVRSYRRRP
jgi:aspartate racemase